jgi:coenzyme F420 hydrogenase subunit beta
MQCGTCAGVCPRDAIDFKWDPRVGYCLHVDAAKCNDCGMCTAVCPGQGLDFRAAAWWRERNGDAPDADFLGPWRKLVFGWATDKSTRYLSASGGAATAILQGALALDVIDAALLVAMDPNNPLATRPVLARTAAEIAACRGSKYNVAVTNVLLKQVLHEPGRYALIGLPCHIQGLRKAQRCLPKLRERVVLAIGLFCGGTAQPRATEITARRLGLNPGELVSVSYRGPGWPGGLRLVTKSGAVRNLPYDDYMDRRFSAYTPPRCRTCPDGLAELADISIGDAWLERFMGSPGVSGIVVRTEVGERLLDDLAPAWLALTPASAQEVLASQPTTYALKRRTFRGRLWLRRLAGRPAPAYPGVRSHLSASDCLAGLADLIKEVVYRIAGDLRYR